MSTGRKFKVGDKVVVSDKATIWLKNKFGGLVGEVAKYDCVYGDGRYTIDFGVVGVVRNEKPICFEKTTLNIPTFSIPTSRETITAEIETLQTKLADARNKIAFMDKVGTDEFDSELYKAYKVLDVVDDVSCSQLDKAKKIIELLKK